MVGVPDMVALTLAGITTILPVLTQSTLTMFHIGDNSVMVACVFWMDRGRGGTSPFHLETTHHPY